jgi:hypothetical protein
MKKSRLRTFARVGAAIAASTGALALGNFASGSAGADPAWSGQATPLVAIGSNTIEDIMDAYAGLAPSAGVAGATFHSYTPLHDPTTFEQVYSWDALNPVSSASDCISAKPGFPAMARPNGSGNGAKALSDAIAGVAWSATSIPGCAATTVGGEIDIARSSSGPGTTAACTFAGANCLAWIDFGHDAVSYAYWINGGTTTTGQVDHLSNAQLTSLYSNTTTGTYVDPATNVKYYACLPQLGSGTEKFFIGKLAGGAGVVQATAEAAATAAGCVNFEENGANTFQTTAAAIPALPAGAVPVTPFSIGSYISQANNVALNRSSTGVTAGVSFGYIDAAGSGQLPYAGVAPNLTPNAAFYGSTYGRDLFLAVDNKKLNGSISQSNAIMKRIFGFLGLNWAVGGGPQANANTASGQLCQAPYQTTTLNTFGFLAPTAAACGAETLTLVTTGTGS